MKNILRIILLPITIPLALLMGTISILAFFFKENYVGNFFIGLAVNTVLIGDWMDEPK